MYNQNFNIYIPLIDFKGFEIIYNEIEQINERQNLIK